MSPVDVTLRLPRPQLVLACLVGLGGALLTVLLGVTGHPSAVLVGVALAAVSAVLSGLVLLARSQRAERFSPVRGCMGAAGLVWGASQLVLLASTGPAGQMTPSVGEAIALAAAPLALASLLSFPRPDGPAGRRWRLGLDAMILSSAAAALLWQEVFRSTTDAATGPLAVAVLLADLGLLAASLQVAVAGLDRGVLVATAGVALFTVGDLFATHSWLLAGGIWPWPATAAACLAWPLVAAGLWLAGTGCVGPAWLQRCSAESRTGNTTTVLLVAIFTAMAVLSVASDRRLDPVGTGLVILLMAFFALREVLLQRQRTTLVRTLTEQARHDFLTELGNRRALSADLDVLTGRERGAGVVVLDLDGFKEVNDRLGHAGGDLLLVEAAAAMRRQLPSGWRTYRLGGDEFAAAGPGGADAATAVAEGMLLAVRRAAASIDGIPQVVVSASAGVAALPPGAAGDSAVVLSEASEAMQEAKRAGRDRVVVHSEEVAALAQRRALVARRLRAAIAEDVLEAALQPLVDIRSGVVIGFEALSRWTDPDLGVVTPDEFVPVAERHGLVLPLGAGVVRKGLAALSSAGGVERRLKLSVNASPIELRSPGYVETVLAALRESGVPTDLLVVEVTEAVYVTPDDPAVGTLEALAREGVRIAVDDFGTGYSSLAYLERLPVHLVKIDRSLTRGLCNPRTRAVVEALVRMSTALGLDVVAEGVEEPGQAQALTELGVRYGQGWLWSRAVPAHEVAALVAGLPSPPSRAPLAAPALHAGRIPAPRSGQG